MAALTVLDSNGTEVSLALTAGTARTLTATTTAANIAAANADRSSLTFQNTSKTIYVWANEHGTAVAGSAGQIVPPLETFFAETGNAISVIAESGTVYCAGTEL